MADSRRWNGSGVRRDDQFVRPPAFRDEHESAHLSPDVASWHGSGSRQVAFAAVLAVAAGIAAVAFMLLVAPGGSGLSDAAPVGAEGDDPVDDPVDLGDVEVPASVPGNGTSASPLPGLPIP